jgi:hypothetical protein
MLALASTFILGFQSRGTHEHILQYHDSESRANLTRLVFSFYYTTSAFIAQKTPLPRIPPLLSGVLSGLLPSDGTGIIEAGACFGFRRNVFTSR